MNIEFEATFLNIEKDVLRDKLKGIGAVLVREEYRQSRVNFDLQSLGGDFWEWARVRDEGDKITMAYKAIKPDGEISDQKEIEFEVSDFDTAKDFMLALGAKQTNYSVTLRERWMIGGVEIDIDTWPHLEPYIEIEGADENSVKEIADKLGFIWDDALFCDAGEIYQMKYGVHPDKLGKDQSITLDFNSPNPLLEAKLKRFCDEKINYLETINVRDGVVCDVYTFDNDDDKDLGIIEVRAGSKTPLQKVLQGNKTIGYVSGEGVLTVDDKEYVFPGNESKEIEVKIGETMQWSAKTDLVFSEVCFPPYQDGRYENIEE